MHDLPKCLRCADVELTPTEVGSAHTIDFFRCVKCQRRYARCIGGPLTFRWLHPISILLHAILYDSDPVARVPTMSDELHAEIGAEKLRMFVAEIAVELEQPTQNVRDILDNRQTEAECRAFLQAFVAHARLKDD